MTGRLAGKSAVVTGTSSGIGRAIALAFLREGARVLGADRAPAPPELTGTAGFTGLEVDLATAGAAEQVFAAVDGIPQILVNNAGIGDARPILDTTDADLERYVRVNLAAPFSLCRAGIAAMRMAGGGCIVNIASVFGEVGAARSSAYSATKAALAGLTRQLAAEYGRDGIRVNAIAPGLIGTALTEERLGGNPWFRRMMIEGCPLGRPGRAEEVAEVCAFLASNAASFVTGIVMPVDGGWSSAKFLPQPD